MVFIDITKCFFFYFEMFVLCVPETFVFVFPIVGNVLLYCCCVLYYNLLFQMRLSSSCSFSVYEDISKMLFLTFLGTYPRSVNNSRTK